MSIGLTEHKISWWWKEYKIQRSSMLLNSPAKNARTAKEPVHHLPMWVELYYRASSCKTIQNQTFIYWKKYLWVSNITGGQRYWILSSWLILKYCQNMLAISNISSTGTSVPSIVHLSSNSLSTVTSFVNLSSTVSLISHTIQYLQGYSPQL